MENRATFLTDLSKCLPADALSTTPTRNKWQVVDYTTETLSGQMVFAQPLDETPTLTLPLHASGWHAISLGLWPGVETEFHSLVKYRLSGDSVFTVVEHPQQSPGLPGNTYDKTEILETFPRYADLTGQALIISKHNTAYPPALACVAYVKLVPLSDSEVAAIRQDRACTDTRKVIAMNDGDGPFFQGGPTTKEELWEQLEPYRHADVGKVLWGVNLGALTYYPSKVGRFFATEDAPCPTITHQCATRSHKTLNDQGIVPFVAAMEYAHQLGLEFHTYYRPAIVDEAHPYFFFSSEPGFLRDHPEYRLLTKSGGAVMKASLAFPQVRDFLVSLMEEAMVYDIDGVHLCFVRGPEYVGYEQPVLDEFRRLYGQDPRTLPDDDPRFLDLKARYVTEFVRAVRQAADQHGAKRGRKIQVSAIFPGDPADMRYFGYDARTWITERLMDFIVARIPSGLIRLAKEHGCQVYFPGGGWDDSLESRQRVVQEMTYAYAAEMDGMALWDLHSGQVRPDLWAIVSRLGHRDEVTDLPASPARYPKMKRVKLITIRGRDFSQTVDKNVPSGWPCERLAIYAGG